MRDSTESKAGKPKPDHRPRWLGHLWPQDSKPTPDTGRTGLSGRGQKGARPPCLLGRLLVSRANEDGAVRPPGLQPRFPHVSDTRVSQVPLAQTSEAPRGPGRRVLLTASGPAGAWCPGRVEPMGKQGSPYPGLASKAISA